MKSGQHFLVLRAIKIALIEHNYRWYIIHLASNQKTVQKRQFNLWKINGYNKESSVKIGRNDMRLTRQIGRLADHIITTLMNACYSS